ncbi:MAG: discoidin domain-containing protein, partial [Luteitalea sp.]
AINGDRTGANWGAGGGWNDATPGSFPDWLQVDFAGAKTISEVAVFSVQDAYTAPVEPTTSQTFSRYGVASFTVQHWDGAQWATVPGGVITGNQSVWRTVTFPAVTTSRVRVVVNGAADMYSRIAEVEAR